MATLTGKIKFEVLPDVVQNISSISTWEQRFASKIAHSITIASGTGANQADQLFHDERTLASAGTDSLDLAGGLTDQFGNTLTMAEVMGFIIINCEPGTKPSATANTTSLTVGGGSNPWVAWITGTTKTVTIPPGGALVAFSPAAASWAVTASTGDILRIVNGSGASCTYEIMIFGRSA